MDHKRNDIKAAAEKLFYSNQYAEAQEKPPKQEQELWQENVSVKMYKGFISLLKGLGADRYDEVSDTIEEVLASQAPFRAAYKHRKIMEAMRRGIPEDEGEQDAKSGRTVGWAGMNYQTLYQAMVALGFTYLQLMDACGFADFPRFEALPQDVQRVYSLVDHLPRAAREGFVRSSALSLTDTFWQKEFWGNKMKANMRRPTFRAIYLFERSTPYKGREMIRLEEGQSDGIYDNDSVQAICVSEMAKIYRLRLAHASLDAKVAPAIAAGLKTSIHWLMAMPENLLVYAENGVTEEIVDAYYFMSKKNKAIFLTALEKFAKQLEGLNNSNEEGAR